MNFKKLLLCLIFLFFLLLSFVFIVFVFRIHYLHEARGKRVFLYIFVPFVLLHFKFMCSSILEVLHHGIEASIIISSTIEIDS